MKRKKYSLDQLVAAEEQHEADMSVADHVFNKPNKPWSDPYI